MLSRTILKMRTHNRIIIAHHLVLTLYGHWPPNDIRGSGSTDFHDEKFAALGPIHRVGGRKPNHLQPTRAELREYHKQVEPLLNFPIFWIDHATRQVIAVAFGHVIRKQKYTCYACAIMKNHMHLVIRRHRDDYQTMFWNFANAAAEALRAYSPLNLEPNHPIFAQRPYSSYCYTPEDLSDRIGYVNENPQKEGLPPQQYDFITPYDNWPHNKRAPNSPQTPHRLVSSHARRTCLDTSVTARRQSRASNPCRVAFSLRHSFTRQLPNNRQ
jgi:REP element-mobilizing transposase RayT